MNKVSMGIPVHILYTSPYGYTFLYFLDTKERIFSFILCVCDVIRNCQTVFQVGYKILYSYQQHYYKDSSCFTTMLKFVINRLLKILSNLVDV